MALQRFSVLLLLAVSIGCHEPVDTRTVPDRDDDGFPLGEDCDDGDAAVHPLADERCDGNDDNCDGRVDEGVTGTWYPDADADGFGGVDGEPRSSCEPPPGYVSGRNGCDDLDADVFPGADEVCNGTDDDCDGAVDVGAGAAAYGTAGRAYLVLGPLAGSSDLADAIVFGGAASGDAFGTVANAGDQDGDGRTDLLFGAYGSDLGATDAGAVHLYLTGSLSRARR